ncbi:hypothetical protein FN846DRAFT_772555 [Sphaerosporella brunnea]|uniref:HotDog domain-containing protein n=1 Tax=Sphaerosporella brunnea TaxID=1250544 RepID=A0A5J5F8F9_9PEZI|nr:hypothetical protein FN846DRAFT_772555 [Sphaerosporella brunnea]
MSPLSRSVLRCFTTTTAQRSSTTITPQIAEAAANGLLQKSLPSIRDWISPQPSHLLSLTLSPYLRTTIPRSSPPVTGELPPGHHLVYFPPQLPEELLLHDGSDAEQSPGPQWPRRMWAGGSITYSSYPANRLQFLDVAVLKERVESVQVRDDKLFVWFERAMHRMPDSGAEPAITERRCLVFLPPREPGTRQPPPQLLKPKNTTDFCETFHPTGHLLMRFSALTFNAHRIHFDTPFSVGEEGYRANLCHGPLAVAFLLGLLKRELGDGKRVKNFEYRCLAPMYVNERYKIAGRKMEDGRFELWAETPEGGYSVKGIAEVEEDAGENAL